MVTPLLPHNDTLEWCGEALKKNRVLFQTSLNLSKSLYITINHSNILELGMPGRGGCGSNVSNVSKRLKVKGQSKDFGVLTLGTANCGPATVGAVGGCMHLTNLSECKCILMLTE